MPLAEQRYGAIYFKRHMQKYLPGMTTEQLTYGEEVKKLLTEQYKGKSEFRLCLQVLSVWIQFNAKNGN